MCLMNFFVNPVQLREPSFIMECLIAPKFAYACLLIDIGLVDHAAQYVSLVIRSIKKSNRTRAGRFSAEYCNAIQSVEQRLNTVTSSGRTFFGRFHWYHSHTGSPQMWDPGSLVFLGRFLTTFPDC